MTHHSCRPAAGVLVALAGLLATACNNTAGPGDQLVCTMNIVPALVVEITDAATGRLLADSARGSAQDGAYVDSLRPAEARSALPEDLLSRAAADERPGTYSVVVLRPGYQAWTRSGVRVEGGACHVQTVRLSAKLVPVP